MDKYEFVSFFQHVASEMRGYDNIRLGGNLGSAIQGYMNLKASEKIAKSIDNLSEVIRNINIDK